MRSPFCFGVACALCAVLLCARAFGMGAAAPASAVSFEKDIAPLFSSCRPCHFPGGTMHAKLPFDQAATVRLLGTKLFKRIKDPKEQALIQRFLDQKNAARAASSGS